jgi:hypothetical protein
MFKDLENRKYSRRQSKFDPSQIWELVTQQRRILFQDDVFLKQTAVDTWNL